MILGPDERVEVRPRSPRDLLKVLAVRGRQRRASYRRRTAEGEGEPRRDDPECEDRRGNGQRRWSQRRDRGQRRSGPAAGWRSSGGRTARSLTPPSRAALAAAVSHSSKRRCVTPRRTSVIVMACSRSYASWAMKVSCSPKRAAAVFSILDRHAKEDAPRPPAPRTAQDLECLGDGGKRRRRQPEGRPYAAWPGRSVQPSTRRVSVAGGTRLRRRLSRIFHRAMSGRRFRVTPVRDGTKGNSHHRICQSPRTHRCWRRACARTLEG